MGIDDNVALGRLTEDLCELHHRERLRRNHVPENISRPHAGKLVYIAHKDQPRSYIHRL